MAMSGWQLWLLLGLALLLADLFVAGGASGVLLVLALAAVGGMIASLFGLDLQGQMLSAAAAAVLATPFVILMLRRLTGGRNAQDTDWRVAGQTFEVVRQGDRLGVRILGDFFPARFTTGGAPTEGQRVRVERFEGIVALVETVESSQSGVPS